MHNQEVFIWDGSASSSASEIISFTCISRRNWNPFTNKLSVLKNVSLVCVSMISGNCVLSTSWLTSSEFGCSACKTTGTAAIASFVERNSVLIMWLSTCTLLRLSTKNIRITTHQSFASNRNAFALAHLSQRAAFDFLVQSNMHRLQMISSQLQHLKHSVIFVVSTSFLHSQQCCWETNPQSHCKRNSLVVLCGKCRQNSASIL